MLVNELGIGLIAICLITGHKSIRTLEIYLKHNNKNSLKGEINKVRASQHNYPKIKYNIFIYF